MTSNETIVHLPAIEKHREHLRKGFHTWPSLAYGLPPAMGDARWPAELILATWYQAAHGGHPGGALRAAELQLEQIRSRLAPTEAAALRLHPWLRRIRKGGLP